MDRVQASRIIAVLVCVTACRAGVEDRTEQPSRSAASAPHVAPEPRPAVSAPAAASVPASAVIPAAVVERIRVPGDLAASVVRGASGEPPRIVFLPGVCSNANAYLQAFPEAARAHGGVVAIEGDKECEGSPGFRTFAADTPRQHGRIEAALAAAGASAIPRGGVTLVGYSQGASIAERLAQRWPERYQRVILIGSPKEVSVESLRKLRAVATMSCALDVPPRMRAGAARLLRAGVPAAYFEMPGCTHGNIADGERVFGEVFAWLDQNARPPDGNEAPVPIAGGLD
jgi:pimeloyl-ACP methyl ester carboxylesterase